MSRDLKDAVTEEVGNCAWDKCKKLGIYWLQGKCYCSNHYGMALQRKNDKDNQTIGQQ